MWKALIHRIKTCKAIGLKSRSGKDSLPLARTECHKYERTGGSIEDMYADGSAAWPFRAARVFFFKKKTRSEKKHLLAFKSTNRALD